MSDDDNRLRPSPSLPLPVAPRPSPLERERLTSVPKRRTGSVVNTAPLLEEPKKRIKPKEGTDPLGLPIQSLDFDQFNSDVFFKELKRKTALILRNESTIRWVITFGVGVAVAVVALVVSVTTEQIFHAKYHWIYERIREEQNWQAYMFSLSVNWGLVLVACLPVIFIEPIAAGGGVAEVKCLLNGMKIPRAVHFKTLLVKLIGTITGVASGLPMGKEGPMIHMGAIVAAGMSQGKSTTLGFDTSWTKFQPFRNDREKRDFISCGAAAGVAAAFAAPIGGVLFALEEGASFWHQSLTWRSFFCTMVTTTSIAVLFSVAKPSHGGAQRVAGLFTFGDFNLTDQNAVTYNLYELLFFAAIGCLGGILGGIWIRLNIRINKLRAKYCRHRPIRQALDCLLMSFFVTSTAYMFSFIFRSECEPLPLSIDGTRRLDYDDGYVQGTCNEEYFNEMFTLYLAPAETAILSLFHSPYDFKIYILFSFFVTYYFLSCTIPGTMTPSGLFVPNLLVGASMGRIVGQFLKYVMPGKTVDPGTYALIGAASFMGGVSRSVVALCVMLVEATGNIQYGLPLMLTLMMAKFAGDSISHGVYEVQIMNRKWAFLEPSPPDDAIGLQSYEIMNPDVKCVKEVMKVNELYKLLVEDWTSHAFPVVAVDGAKSPPMGTYTTLPSKTNDSIPMDLASPSGIGGTTEKKKRKKSDDDEDHVPRNVTFANTPITIPSRLDQKSFGSSESLESFDASSPPPATSFTDPSSVLTTSVLTTPADGSHLAEENDSILNQNISSDADGAKRQLRKLDSSDDISSEPVLIEPPSASGSGHGKNLSDGPLPPPPPPPGPPPPGPSIPASSHPLRTSSISENYDKDTPVLQRYSTFWMPSSDETRLANSTSHGAFRGLILRKHLLVVLKYKAFVKEKPIPGVSPPLLEWFTFEHRYPRYPELKDINLSDQDKAKWVDVTPYMHRSPITVFWFTPVTQVYNIFRTLGLRHIPVLNAAQHVVGMITRKSISHAFIDAIAEESHEEHKAGHH